jgi:hypothetical protein
LNWSQLAGSEYVKITPAVWPTAVVLTERIPPGDSVIPLGKAAPLGLTPKAPPLTTPDGSVPATSKVALMPLVNTGKTTIQACDGEGPGAGAGPGVGPGGAGAGASPGPGIGTRPNKL